MTTKKLLAFSTVLMFFVLSSCGPTLKVASDYDKSNDFTKYKTYKYIPQPFDTVTMEPLVPLFRQRRIEAGIDLQLENLGYRYSEDNPDFLVSYFVKVAQETRLESGGVSIGIAAPMAYTNPAYNMNYGNRYYSGNPYTYDGGSYGWVSTGGTMETYSTGSLMVDIVDAKTVQLVWYGRAQGEISSDPKDTQATIDKACSDVFSRFLWKAE
jgi:hypothetical protein